MQINPVDLSTLKASFNDAKPFKYLVIENFLDNPKELINEVKQVELRLNDSDLFKFFQSSDLSRNENSKHLQEVFNLINFIKDKSFLQTIAGKKLAKADFQITKYKPTHYLLLHDDQLEGRKIAYLYYCSSLEKDAGGALELFTTKDKRPIKVSKSIQPKANTLVLFEVSSKSFH